MSGSERASAHIPPDASGIDVESGVGADSRLGYVHLRWGPMSGQLTTREARAHALSILEAADAAEHDAVVLRWLMDTLEMDVARAAHVIADLRRLRIADEGGA